MTGLGNIDDVYKHYLKVIDENQQLKELLKECREILDYAKDFAYHDPCCKCIDKINQEIGEMNNGD